MTNQPEWLEEIRRYTEMYPVGQRNAGFLLQYVDVLRESLITAKGLKPEACKHFTWHFQSKLGVQELDELDALIDKSLNWQPGASEKGGKGDANNLAGRP